MLGILSIPFTETVLPQSHQLYFMCTASSCRVVFSSYVVCCCLFVRLCLFPCRLHLSWILQPGSVPFCLNTMYKWMHLCILGHGIGIRSASLAQAAGISTYSSTIRGALCPRPFECPWFLWWLIWLWVLHESTRALSLWPPDCELSCGSAFLMLCLDITIMTVSISSIVSCLSGLWTVVSRWDLPALGT